MAVMNVKSSTKTWSEPKTNNQIVKDDGIKNLSVQDQEKIGNEDVGTTLNKLVDPNYVDPQKKTRAVGNAQLDKDAFMRLMLAQMKQQDPTNPLKSHEMAAQLAQFTSLEQLQNMNTTLTQMKGAQEPTFNYQALSFIGKTVSGDAAKLHREAGDKEHDFKFNLPADAQEVTVKVRDANGDIVKTLTVKELKKGENKITWNGQDEKGSNVAPGDYEFIPEAKAGGKKLALQTGFAGTVTGVNYTSGGPVLLVGTQTIKMSDVKKIIDPAVERASGAINDQKKSEVSPQDLRGPQILPDNKKTEAQPPKGNLNKTVAMSQGMMNKLGKETEIEK